MLRHPESPAIIAGRDITPSILRGMNYAVSKANESAIVYGRDMPVGASASFEGAPVSQAFARDNELENPYLHAEVLAALNIENDDRLLGRLTRDEIMTILAHPELAIGDQRIDTLYVTLEPCIQCVDILTSAKGLKRIIYALGREEASNRNLVRFHDLSASRHAEKQGYDFEVAQVIDPIINVKALSTLDGTKREPGVDHVRVSSTEAAASLHRTRTITLE